MGKKELELENVLAESLNKQSKDQKIAYFLDTTDAPTNVDTWVSTGATFLDLAISNRPNGGLPVGRIAEITGLEASGKSLLSAHLLAETQKVGGVAVLIDTETAVSREFFEAIGVDVSKLVYVTADSVEQIFETIETIIEKVRVGNKDRQVTIVVDSVAAASTKKELDSSYEKEGYATDKAIIISKAMRKITNTIGRQNILLVFTNQLRHKMNAMPFADPWTTSGGKAIAYHCSVRIRLKNMGNIKAKVTSGERIVGLKVRAQVVKNRVGPPLRSADFDIFFDRGIDNYSSWLVMMKDNGIVKQAGAWYEYIDIDTEQSHKFQSKDFQKLLEEHPTIKEQIYKRICDSQIMAYKSNEAIDGDVLSVDYSDTLED